MPTRRLALLVNPHAGGGRPLRLLPRVEARLRDLGLSFTVAAHAEPAPRLRARARGRRTRRDAVALSRRRPHRRGRRRAARGPAPFSASCPAAAATTSRAMIGLPLDAVAACDVLAHGARGADRHRRRRAGARSSASPRSGFDSDAQPDRNAAPPRLGAARLRLRRAARARARGSPRASRSTVDGETRAFRGWSVAAANSGATVAGCASRPTPGSTTARSTSCSSASASQARATCARCRSVFHGAHVSEPDRDACCAAPRSGERRPPVHRLRRRRPDRQAARHAARASRRAAGPAAGMTGALECGSPRRAPRAACRARAGARRDEPAGQGPACASSRTRSGGSPARLRTAAP